MPTNNLESSLSSNRAAEIRQQELARQRRLAEEARKAMQEAAQAKQINSRLETQVKNNSADNFLPGLQLTDSSPSHPGMTASPLKLSQAVLNATAGELHTAIDGKTVRTTTRTYSRFGVTTTENQSQTKANEAEVSRLLSVLTEAQKQQVEQAYDKNFHRNMVSDVDGRFDTTDQLKVKDILNKADNGGNYAGDLAVMLSQTHGTNGDSANGAIMQYLSTMSAAQMKTMESQYKTQFGTTLQDAANKTGVGQDLQHALPMLLKGADQRTSADDLNIVKIVSQYGGTDGADLVQAALGGSSAASVQARMQILHDHSLMQKLDSQYSGQQLAEVNDFVRNGQISLSTILNSDHKNPADLVQALQTATPQEKLQYLIGEGLANSGHKPKDAAGQEALHLYQQVHSALTKTGKSDQAKQWSAMLTGDSLNAKLAASAKNTAQLMHTVEGMSQQDWQALNDPTAGKALRGQLVQSMKAYATPEQQKQIFDFLARKLTVGSYENSLHVSQPFLNTVADDHSTSNVVFALQHFNAQDAQKYKDDAAYRKQVDTVIGGLTEAGKAYATNVLEQVGKTGQPPVPNAADNALAAIASGADHSTTLTSIQKALAENPQFLKHFAKNQQAAQLDARLQHGEHITAALETELKTAPSGSLNPAEQALMNYIRTLPPGQSNSLLSSVKLPLEEQLNQGISTSYVYTQLADAPVAQQEAVLRKLSPEQKQLAEAYIHQRGKPSTADQIRAYVLGNDQNYTVVGQELQSMTPQQKVALFNEYSQKYGSNLSADFLAKLPAADKQNYQDLLSMRQVSAQSDFANALINNGDHQHGVEDGSAFTAIRATQQFADALQAANAFHQALTPEALEQLNSTVAQAQQDYQAAVTKYGHDHPGFWKEAEHIAEQVAVVAVTTAVTIGVGAVTCGLGGAVVGGLTYALLSQAVNCANGGSWNWASFAEQAGEGTVMAFGGEALGLAKGLISGAGAASEAAATTAGDALVEGGATAAASVATAAASGAGASALRSAAQRVTALTNHINAIGTPEESSFSAKLAGVSARAGRSAVVGGATSTGITGGISVGTGIVTGKWHGGALLSSFEQGAIGGAEFSFAGEALTPAMMRGMPGLFRSRDVMPPGAPSTPAARAEALAMLKARQAESFPSAEAGARLAPGDHTLSLDVEGRTRTFDVHVPASYDGEQPLPVMLLLDGVNKNQLGVRAAETQMNALAEREGFAVVYPYALDEHKMLGAKVAAWNSEGTGLTNHVDGYDDANFLDAVIQDMHTRISVDASRIYGVGFSEGGMFLNHYQATRPGTLAGLGLVHGTMNGAEPLPLGADGTPAPIDAVVVHSTKDTSLPFKGGRGRMTLPFKRFAASRPAMQATFWAEANDSLPPAERSTPVYDQVDYVSRDGEHLVRQFIVKGGGHAWDGSPLPGSRIFGRPSDKFSTSEALWDFLKDRTLARSLTDDSEVPLNRKLSYDGLLSELSDKDISPAIIAESIKPENLLGQGNSNYVYRIDGVRNFVLRIPKTADASEASSAALEPVSDYWPERNLGQPVARLGDIQILKKVYGDAIVSAPSRVSSTQRLLTMLGKETPLQRFMRQERVIAAMPQTAYDDLASTMVSLLRRRKYFDAVNPGNLLIGTSAFNPVDIGNSPIITPTGAIDGRSAGAGLYEMLRPLTGTGIEQWGPNVSKLQESYRTIIEKAVSAAQEKGLEVTPDPRLAYLFHIAGMSQQYVDLMIGRSMNPALHQILQESGYYGPEPTAPSSDLPS